MNVNDIQVPGSDAVWRDLRKRIDDLEKRLTDMSASVARFGLDIRDRRGNPVFVTDKETGYGLSAPRAINNGWLKAEEDMAYATGISSNITSLWKTRLYASNPYFGGQLFYSVPAGTTAEFNVTIYGGDWHFEAAWESGVVTESGYAVWSVAAHETGFLPTSVADVALGARWISGPGPVGVRPMSIFGSPDPIEY